MHLKYQGDPSVKHMISNHFAVHLKLIQDHSECKL